MDASTDPLLLLRDAIINSSEIKLLNGQGQQVERLADCTDISLPPYTSATLFPRTTSTRYLQTTSGNLSIAPRYQLQAVLFAYISRDEQVRNYIRQATESGVTTFLSVTDRKPAVEWLTGKSALESLGAKLAPLGGDVTITTDDTAASSAVKRGADGTAVAGGDAKTIAEESTTSAVTTSQAVPAAKRQRFVPNVDDQEKVKRMLEKIEGPLWGIDASAAESSRTDTTSKQGKKGAGVMKNRESVLEGQRINNFESVRSLVAPRLHMSREMENDKKNSMADGSGPASAASGKSKRKLNDPIIIVSPSSSALINMHNVKRFLEQSMFEPPEVARMSGQEETGGLVHINHSRTTSTNAIPGQPGKSARYFIVDSVEALERFKKHSPGEDPWDRVVCVMTTGQEWQFRPYKWPEPKELFHHVKGVFVQWTTDLPNTKVRSWNVSELRIDPSKRHIDKSTVANFWRELESWIAMHKPHLSY